MNNYTNYVRWMINNQTPRPEPRDARTKWDEIGWAQDFVENKITPEDERIARAYLRDAQRLVDNGVAEFVESPDGKRLRARRVSTVTIERYMQASKYGMYRSTVVSFHRGNMVKRYETNPFAFGRISDESVRRAFAAQRALMEAAQ